MVNSVRVVPAILTDASKTLETMLRQSETFTDYVQIDIMDGKFVPSHSITWEHMASVPTKLGWEAHLMVEHPEEHLEGFKKAGARRIIFHFEATPAPEKVILSARKLDLRVGLALNPETLISSILCLVAKIDCVLFLSVNPGFYGAKFIPEVLAKIVEFRRVCPGVESGIDGGIKENNIEQIAQTGVDNICVGSAVFSQPDPGQSYRRLLSLAQKGRQKLKSAR